MKFALSCLLFAMAAGSAQAGPVLDHVRSEQRVRCGAVERPGIAEPEAGEQWRGMAVDICRAVAAAVLGAPDKIVFSAYETPKQFDRLRAHEDDVAFLTGTEIRLNHLADALVPGPTIYFQTHRIMVPDESPARGLADLSRATICFMSGSPVERSVTDWFDRHHLPFQPIPFTEDGEMVDGYRAGHCQAIAYETTTLVPLLAEPVHGSRGNRILDEPVVTFPVIAATGTQDGQWSAIIAWTIDTLIAGERAETPWYSGGAGAMPVDARQLGLDSGWQRRVLQVVGHYGQIFDRNVGPGSNLNLARGPNADPASGGLLMAPFLE